MKLFKIHHNFFSGWLLKRYEITKDCWKAVADQRPYFSGLVKLIEAKISNKNDADVAP